jgi:NADPH:quinone reductase-like Zn-dependent oxidoreductase
VGWAACQSYHPFGTAAEYVVVPLRQAVPLPDAIPMEQGACLGIPGVTAHRAVYVGGSVEGRTVLVQGGAGAVGACAVQVAHRGGARVIATCRSEDDRQIAARAGADEVLLTGDSLKERIRAVAPNGVDHIVEVAFAADINADIEALAQGGSVATYATNAPTRRFRSGNLSLRTRDCSSSAVMTFLRRRRSKQPERSTRHLRRAGRDLVSQNASRWTISPRHTSSSSIQRSLDALLL